MLLIGGCELSLERNPVAKIDQINIDENTGVLAVEEFKDETNSG